MNMLAIVIVSWNTAAVLRRCLHALDAQAINNDCQIVVVDNASTDGSPEMVRREFPGVKLLANTENVGYARANNQGIATTNSDFVLLLNSDAIADHRALNMLVELLRRSPEIGAVSPLLLTPSGDAQTFAFGHDPTPWFLLKRGFYRLFTQRKTNWRPVSATETDWVSGACMMLRRTALNDVGGLDEHIFMYFEDNDLCLRLRKAGHRVVYYPDVHVTHIGGQSVKRNPRALNAYRESLRYFYSKHYSWLDRLLLRIMLPLYAALTRNP